MHYDTRNIELFTELVKASAILISSIRMMDDVNDNGSAQSCIGRSNDFIIRNAVNVSCQLSRSYAERERRASTHEVLDVVGFPEPHHSIAVTC